MRAWNWPLVGFFVLMIAFVVIGTIDALEPAFCEPGRLAEASKQQNVVLFRCWEFWINRYQALLGNILTATVAGATLLWVARQLKAADRQASVAAAQSLRVKVHEIEEEIAEARNVGRLANDLDGICWSFPYEQQNRQSLFKRIEETRAITDTLIELSHKRASKTFANPSGNSKKSRAAYGRSLQDLCAAAISFSSLMTRMTDDHGAPPANAQTIVDKLAETISMAIGNSHVLSEGLKLELREVWQAVRAFESAAIK